MGSLTEGMFLKPLTNRAPNDAAMFPQKPRGLPPRGLHDLICRTWLDSQALLIGKTAFLTQHSRFSGCVCVDKVPVKDR